MTCFERLRAARACRRAVPRRAGDRELRRDEPEPEDGEARGGEHRGRAAHPPARGLDAALRLLTQGGPLRAARNRTENYHSVIDQVS